MDTRDVLVVSPTSDGLNVDLVEDASNARMDAWFQQHGVHKLIIATGFIAKNLEVRQRQHRAAAACTRPRAARGAMCRLAAVSRH